MLQRLHRNGRLTALSEHTPLGSLRVFGLEGHGINDGIFVRMVGIAHISAAGGRCKIRAIQFWS
jgi:hypothetical protein